MTIEVKFHNSLTYFVNPFQKGIFTTNQQLLVDT